MLIELSSELLPSGARLLHDDDFCAAMDHLLDAHRYGQHAVVMDREVIAWLEGASLSRRSRGALKHLRERVFQYPSLLRRVREHLLVVAADQDRVAWSGPVCRVPWRWFVPPTSTSPTRLIGEQVDRDVTVYHAFASALLAESGLLAALSGQGGGGSSTGANLKNEALKSQIVLAVVDSDRESEQHRAGDTSWAAIKAASEVGARRDPADQSADRPKVPVQQHDKAIARLIVLQVRELENLIPAELWRLALKAPDYLSQLESLAQQGLLGEGRGRWVDLKASPHRLVGKDQDALKLLAEVLSQDPRPDPLAYFPLSAHPELARVVHTIAEWGLASPPLRT